MSTDSPTVTAEVAPRGRRLLGHWPILLGLAAATFQIVTGVASESVAITVAVAATCYLAAAALNLRWVAWAGILVGSVVVTLSELAGIPWWAGLAGYAVILALVGLLGPAPVSTVTAQSLALLGFGGMAVAAVLVAPRLGLALAGVALAGHAVWDYRHWRRNDVVPRSLAEFCIVLDVPFGIAAIALAITN